MVAGDETTDYQVDEGRKDRRSLPTRNQSVKQQQGDSGRLCFLLQLWCQRQGQRHGEQKNE